MTPAPERSVVVHEGESAAWRIEPGSLDVRWAGEMTPADDPEGVERAWGALRARFPRMYDGPISAAAWFEAGSPRVEAMASSYKPYATGVRDAALARRAPTLLAVTGFVLGHGEHDEPRVLLARRGRATWLYVGMWELAPAGGVPPPRSVDLDSGRLRTEALAAHLLTELREETGLRPGEGDASAPTPLPVAMVHDASARSLDIVLRLDVRDARSAAAGSDGLVHDAGEYASLRWVPLSALRAFVAEHSGLVIAPTIAVLRALGLIG